MSYVFVSHASEDDDIVSQICQQLRSNGIITWCDHDDIPPGDLFDSTIQNALNSCSCGLFVLTPASAISPECNAEYRRIQKLGRRLYVAVAKTVDTETFPWSLGIIQYVNLIQNLEEGILELARAIKEQTNLNESLPSVKPVPPLSQLSHEILGSPNSREGKNPDTVKSKATVIFKLDYDISEYPIEKLADFICILHEKGLQSEISFVRIERGSVILTLELDEDDAEYLAEMFSSQPSLFTEFRVMDISFSQFQGTSKEEILESEDLPTCPHCQKQFRTQNVLDIHITISHPQENWENDYTHIAPDQVILEEKNTKSESTPICPYCQRRFRTQDELTFHIVTRHADKLKAPPPPPPAETGKRRDKK